MLRRPSIRSAVTTVLLLATLPSSIASAAAPAFRRVNLPNRLYAPRLGTVADVTGDGRLDIVAGSSFGIFVFPGNGSGEFLNWYRASDDTLSIANLSCADFDHDGVLDCIAGGVLEWNGSQPTYVVRIYFGTPDGYFRRSFDITGPYPFPQVGDFNGDGFTDFVRGLSEWYRDPNRGGAFRGVLETSLSDAAGGFAAPIRSIFQDPNSSASIRYVADLNSDGRTDVVLFTQSVTLADGSGGFETPIALTPPPIPLDAIPDDFPPRLQDVAVGDLNGDGNRDLLMRFSYSKRDPEYKWGDPREFSSMYWGDGSGHFSAPVQLAEPPNHARTVVTQFLTDVNGDGRDDIVLASPNTFVYESPLFGAPRPADTYLNVGGGQFSGPIMSLDSGGLFLASEANKAWLHNLDIDGDGHADLVMEDAHGLRVVRGDGNGSFRPATVVGGFDTSLTAGAVVGDFNRDGELDIAVANSGSYTVSVWLNDGNGGWSGPSNYKLADRHTAVAMITADLNGDGILDLATASHGEVGAVGLPGVSVLYGDGAGHFALGRELHIGTPIGLVADDFDHDGTIDLAVADNYERVVTIFYDFAGATHEVELLDNDNFEDGSPYGLAALAAADFDGNGFTDLVRNSITGTLSVFLNPGDPDRRQVVRVAMGIQTNGVAAGDLDGDGIADLAVPIWESSSRLGAVLVARGNGTGTFGAPAKYSLDADVLAQNIAIADLDGHGQRAVVTDSEGLQVLLADDSGRLGPPITFGTRYGSLRTVALVDLNHDGLLDAVRPDAIFFNLGTCGNGRIDGAEECDDGNTTSCDGCSAACRIEPGGRCGDGIINTTCSEQCDNGADNSDTRPDACRTTCRAPRCGDGVVDAGEECDDGNRVNCDGCSSSCTLDPAPVCGDGIVNTACGEACDDANQTIGDGCSQCQLELVPGGGPPSTDCILEWVVANSHNSPLTDRRGRALNKQRCHDNDPACDFDGGVTGSCTFHVAMCIGINDRDLPRCNRAAMASYEVMQPSATKAARSTVLAGIRARVDAMADSMMSQPLGSCSSMTDLEVPVGKQVVKARATTVKGRRDTDTLTFKCIP